MRKVFVGRGVADLTKSLSCGVKLASRCYKFISKNLLINFGRIIRRFNLS